MELQDKDVDVPTISIRGYAFSHEDLYHMMKNVEEELKEARKELGYK